MAAFPSLTAESNRRRHPRLPCSAKWLDEERCRVTDFSAEEFFQEEDARASGASSQQPSWAPIIIDVGEDLDPIPPRAWLLSTTFCREFVSSLLAAGATGKTALRIAQLLALAT